MARDWGNQGRGKLGCSCSYKRTTIIVCSINIVVALYVLRSLYASLYVYSNNDSRNAVKYTPDQIRKMEESNQIRKAAEPLKLMKLVKKLKMQYADNGEDFQLPQPLKGKIVDEILQRLRGLNASANVTEQREMVESWRKQKLEEARRLTGGNSSLNSNLLPEEAGLLLKALDSRWAALSEEIGLWIPVEVIHKEHDDKSEGEDEEEEEVLAGRPLPPECHTELHTDYGGAAVRWGLTNPKESAADCCQACLDQAKNAKPGQMKCNIWVYCPEEAGCFSPDIYEHKHQECWLKYDEKPKITFKDKYSEAYRNAHPTAPVVVPWVAGVVSV